jgi:hydroxyacylglutathione hydrolase
MEIIPGIHKIDGIKMVNCYLIVNDGFICLVDTGMAQDAQKTLDYLAKLGKNPSDLKYIILTHADIDHIGCAAQLKQITGAKIAIHSLDVPILTGKAPFKPYLGPQPFRYLANRWLRSLPYKPVGPDIILNDHSIIEGWQIVFTPGHTSGSVCLFNPGRCLIVGDALRTSWRGKPRPISRKICVDLDEVRKSLFVISKLEYDILLPGHGAPILKNASQIIRDMVARYESRGRL